VWVDTGIDLPEGDRLMVPSGHSHHAWIISGPEVNAQVMFYLGISGAAFFAKTQKRPSWARERSLYRYDSGASATAREKVLLAADAASSYLRVLKQEAKTKAANLPADGYGYLGVCNDSNAVLEFLVQRGQSFYKRVTTYPLLRNASFKVAGATGLYSAKDLKVFDRNDNVDEKVQQVLSGLPTDTIVGTDEKSKRQTLRRILSMHPYGDKGDPVWDFKLRSQMDSVRRSFTQE